MSAIALSQPTKASVWTGRVLGAVAVLFMIFDAVIHVLNPSLVVQASAQLGFPAHLMPIIGIIELACVALYVVPRTSFLGALLLTGYLGGATAIQVRAGSVAFQFIFPAIVATLLWASLVLRDVRVRNLVVGASR